MSKVNPAFAAPCPLKVGKQESQIRVPGPEPFLFNQNTQAMLKFKCFSSRQIKGGFTKCSV